MLETLKEKLHQMLFPTISIIIYYKLSSSEGTFAALAQADNVLKYGDCFFFTFEIEAAENRLEGRELETSVVHYAPG